MCVTESERDVCFLLLPTGTVPNAHSNIQIPKEKNRIRMCVIPKDKNRLRVCVTEYEKDGCSLLLPTESVPKVEYNIQNSKEKNRIKVCVCDRKREVWMFSTSPERRRS